MVFHYYVRLATALLFVALGSLFAQHSATLAPIPARYRNLAARYAPVDAAGAAEINLLSPSIEANPPATICRTSWVSPMLAHALQAVAKINTNDLCRPPSSGKFNCGEIASHQSARIVLCGETKGIMCKIIKGAAEDLIEKCAKEGFGVFTRVSGRGTIEGSNLKIMIVWNER